MSDFVVSARKYRPQTFDSVVGQNNITSTLKIAIKNQHLAQAFLFCGSRGVGKTTTARILAKTINCSNRSENVEACETCDSCISFQSGNSFNILEVDGASNNGKEDIKVLIEQIRIPPQLGKYTIYIIDEVHMLSTAAFNAFLKTLEEPPAHAIFILATTEKHKIIPTILSRCQIFDFHKITVKDMATHLGKIAEKENITADADALHLIAMKSEGSLRDALTIFDQILITSESHISYQHVLDNLHVLDYDYYFKMLDYFKKEDISGSLLLFNDILEQGFDGYQFLLGISDHFRNLMVCKDVRTAVLLDVVDSIQEKYIEQAKQWDLMQIMRALHALSIADVNYKASKNSRLLIEVTLMELGSLQQDSEKKNS